MQLQRRRVIWPYLALLGSLFALSLNAPRSWQADRASSTAAAHRSRLHRRVDPLPLDVTDWPANRSGNPNATAGGAKAAAAERSSGDSLQCEVTTGYDPRESDSPAESLIGSVELAPETMAEEATTNIDPPPVVPGVDEYCPVPWPLDEPAVASDAFDETGVANASAAEGNWTFDARAAQTPVQLKPAGTLPAFANRVAIKAMELVNTPLPRLALPTIEFPWPEAARTARQPAWPQAAALTMQMQSLTLIPEAAPWANYVGSQLRALQSELLRTSPSSQATLAALRASLDELPPIEAQIKGAIELRALRRARYAVIRRLDVWERLAAEERPAEIAESTNGNGLAACLAAMDGLAGGTPAGPAWREYLLVDQLRLLSAEASSLDQEEARRLARRVLGRLDAGRLTAAQRSFVKDPHIASLADELCRWAAEPVTAEDLLGHLERYEAEGSAAAGRRVAEDLRNLSWSSREDDRSLAEQLTAHWRNANVRVAFSQALINRFLPPPKVIDSPVHDMILGARVRGHSTTFPKLFVRLIPDRQRVRMGLEASGLVASDTLATSGSATFHTAAESSFSVQKLVVYGPQGMRVMPAEGRADAHFDHLQSVETNYDGVPFLGFFARQMAQSQHDESRPRIRQASEARLVARARQEFDAAIGQRLEKMNRELDRSVLSRLVNLGLEPTTIDASTSGERAIVRMRLAAANQLGAHTPRPLAPSDSQLSLQMHESAINNLLERLELDGRTFELPQLFEWINRKLERPAEIPDDLPDDVRIRFADHDSIRVRCRNNRLELTLSLAQLSQNKIRWRDFCVMAQYRLSADGLQPQLEREGPISLDGPTLRGRPEVVLRGIFSKVLSKARRLPLIDEKFAADPRLHGLAIRQIVLDEGWLGIAVGPQLPSRVAEREAPAAPR